MQVIRIETIKQLKTTEINLRQVLIIGLNPAHLLKNVESLNLEESNIPI